MNVLFAGTPAFVVPVLRAIHESAHDVVAVITQPDRRGGRGHRVLASPVKEEALRLGLPVHQPEDINAADSPAALRSLAPDAMMVAAYGRMLSRELLALPRLGCLNVHLSLLPKYRGAAPVARAIERGDEETGVTLMRMTPKMDSGPALLQERLAIGPRETAGELRDRLGVLGAPAAVEALNRVAAGTAEFRDQDAAGVTFAPAILKEHGLIDWRRPAVEIERLVRAMNPWPMACTFCGLQRDGRPKRLILVEAEVCDAIGAPGEVVSLDPDGPVVATGEGALRLRRVHPAGSREMSGNDFARGRRLAVGNRIGEGRNDEASR